MTNTTLRNRFGLGESYQSQISRLIRLAIEKQLINPFDESTALDIFVTFLLGHNLR